MKRHRSPKAKVPNTDPEDNFNPGDALERLHIEIVQLEAIAHAASEAIIRFPYPPPGERRRAFARIYSLVTKTAEEADLAVALGQKLVTSLGKHLQSWGTAS